MFYIDIKVAWTRLTGFMDTVDNMEKVINTMRA